MLDDKPIYLQCPYREKDQAKALGALWDIERKSWYIPPKRDIEPFRRWLPADFDIKDQIVKNEDNDFCEFLKESPDDAPQYTVKQFIDKVQGVFFETFSANSAFWLIGQAIRIKPADGSTKRLNLELIDPSDANLSPSQSSFISLNAWGADVDKIFHKLQETGINLQEGSLVRVKVIPQFHPKYHLTGRLIDIDPSITLGVFALQVKKLREKLKQEGIYDKNKRLAAPCDFCRVAVIHPPNASGFHDFKKDADRLESLNLCKFHYISSSFEGQNSETAMLQAFDKALLAHQDNPIDALIIIRGGGAKQGLISLVKESIVRQICLFPIPVFTGLGHADDNMLLDDVAACRFDTPSKVIEHITKTVKENTLTALAAYQSILQISSESLIYLTKKQQDAVHYITARTNGFLNQIHHKIVHFKQSVHQIALNVLHLSNRKLQADFQATKMGTYQSIHAVKNRIADYHRCLAGSISMLNRANNTTDHFWNMISKTADRKISEASYTIAQLFHTVKNNSQAIFKNYEKTLTDRYEKITLLDPANTLNRGYVLALDQSGNVIKSKKQAKKQLNIILRFHDGICPVTIVQNEENSK